MILATAYGTNNPSVFGHTSDEIDFTNIEVGDIYSYGKICDSNGCIGDGGTNFNSDLKVSGNIDAKGVICDSNGCIGDSGSNNQENEWKLLAKGSDWTEIVNIILSNTGSITYQTDFDINNQKISISRINWPTATSTIKEINFIVKNNYESFCVGGYTGTLNSYKYGNFDISGLDRSTSTRCVGYSLKFDSYGYEPAYSIETMPNWIRLGIDSKEMTKCPQQAFNLKTPPKTLATTDGAFGVKESSVSCLYKVNTDWPTGGFEKISIKEVDLSAGFGSWEWEIWYR